MAKTQEEIDRDKEYEEAKASFRRTRQTIRFLLSMAILILSFLLALLYGLYQLLIHFTEVTNYIVLHKYIQILIVPLMFGVGYLMSLAKAEYLKWYSIIEVAFGVAAIYVSLPFIQESRGLASLGAAVYIVVRGLDNYRTWKKTEQNRTS